MSPRLHELLAASAARRGTATAVEDPLHQGAASYHELEAAARRVHDVLLRRGVGPGDRIGISGKSIPVVASIFGILKAGAAYVPVDPSAPLARSSGIFQDCAVAAALVPEDQAEAYAQALGQPGSVAPLTELGGLGPPLALVDGPGAKGKARGAQDLSYILYTSGSTGKPKGVVHTHRSALAFVDWCSREFTPTEADRFSSHAPFHFDLSIFDIYLPLKHGGVLVLIGDELGKHPTGLAQVIAERRITVWYSTPSILRLLLEFGKLERHDYDALRLACFAGEVFPLKHLRAMLAAWPKPRWANLYGPTETNVCTWYPVPAQIPAERTDPFPIGKPCSDDRTLVVDEQGRVVATGQEGELLVAGGSVMQGYWNDPVKTEASFQTVAGERWYKTGDLVREDAAGDYLYLGRRDRMVKRRGYRIELGEIEAGLYRHPRISEAAAVAIAAADGSVQIKAFVACKDGGTLTMLELKQWCAEQVPLYMVPDRFECRAGLPKTSTDKIDYQTLKRG